MSKPPELEDEEAKKKSDEMPIRFHEDGTPTFYALMHDVVMNGTLPSAQSSTRASLEEILKVRRLIRKKYPTLYKDEDGDNA